jgi:hypothetical protein
VDERQAFGWLIVGLINEHFPYPSEDDPAADNPQLGTTGCLKNCGLCAALAWFDEPLRRGVLEDYVRATSFHAGGWAYWDDESDKLRWDWFENFWARHRACWVSNGETGCYGA